MGYHRPQATRPVKHKGRFFDTTIRFDQSVFALCPSRKQVCVYVCPTPAFVRRSLSLSDPAVCGQVRPSNCLMVEVFSLAGKDSPKDQIVGWGVLPMCNPRFRIVQVRVTPRDTLLALATQPVCGNLSCLEDAYLPDLPVKPPSHLHHRPTFSHLTTVSVDGMPTP